MLLVYTNENAKLSPEDTERTIEGHRKAMGEATRRGILIAAEPLERTASATTIRTRDGKPTLIDGPFAETKEQLAGYYLLDCKDLDEALEIASLIPTCCGGGAGCIEVRPLRPFPASAPLKEEAGAIHA
jgi:hypothetical protein